MCTVLDKPLMPAYLHEKDFRQLSVLTSLAMTSCVTFCRVTLDLSSGRASTTIIIIATYLSSIGIGIGIGLQVSVSVSVKLFGIGTSLTVFKSATADYADI